MSCPSDATSPARVCIAISTVGAKVGSIKLPAQSDGLSYLILVQKEADCLPYADRSDVRVVSLDSIGLSRSRNAALDLCEAEYLLVSDDDIELDTVGIRALADVLDSAPDLAFVAGWRAGRLRHSSSYRIRWYNGGHICAPELMIRMAPVARAGIRFDTRFGVGAEHPIGEDYIFVCDMLDAGLVGRSVPVVTGTHHGMSSGEIWDDPKIMQARQAMLRRCFGRWAPVLQVIYAFRLRRRFESWRAALAFAFSR